MQRSAHGPPATVIAPVGPRADRRRPPLNALILPWRGGCHPDVVACTENAQWAPVSTVDATMVAVCVPEAICAVATSPTLSWVIESNTLLTSTPAQNHENHRGAIPARRRLPVELREQCS